MAKKNEYPAIYIEWCDASANNDAWQYEDDILDWAKQDTVWLIKEVGFIIKETKEYILLASKYHPHESGNKLDGCMKIPKTWIRKRKVISSF